ncbi:MAG: hypothetical protein J6A79_03575 [Clostridia bacterium]|nr:hypothetical protein [Clostridia bacterium]
METFDIEILDEEKPGSQAEFQLPVNYTATGTVNTDDVKIYIRRDVYESVRRYATSDTSRELGCILVGNYLEDIGFLHVVIDHFIPARYTESGAATLTFTHETWNDIYREMDEKYPAERIVGWQHTHPGYGVFLSSYDLFIQEYFFNGPFQLAYVIDPVQHQEGFFQWKKGSVEKSGGFYIYEEPESEPAAKNKPSHVGRRSRKTRYIIFIALLAALAAALIGWHFWQQSRVREKETLLFQEPAIQSFCEKKQPCFFQHAVQTYRPAQRGLQAE